MVEDRSGDGNGGERAFALAMGIALAAAGTFVPFLTGTAAASTMSTNWMELDGVPDVEVKCTLTVDSNDFLEQKCKFRNTGGSTHKLLFCMMIDHKNGHQSVSGLNPRSYQVQVVNNNGNQEVRCVDTGSSSGDTTFHWGCEFVEVKPGQTVTVDFGKSSQPYKTPPGMSSPDAWDFKVNYADYVKLDGSQYTYNPSTANCDQPVGQGNFLSPNVPGVSAVWVTEKLPFDDPYVSFQTAGEEMREPGYATEDESPCLPEDFPVRTDQLPRCPGHEGEPPPMPMPLYLFWWRSAHSEEEGQTWETRLEVETEGETEGIRVESEPAAGESFEIRAGERQTGTLRLCAEGVEDRCAPPQVEEGRTLDVRVNAVDNETGDLRFPQEVRFIEDTRPPVVTDRSSEQVEGEGTQIQIETRDETTSPLGAEIWYRPVEGEEWRRETMEPQTDPLNLTRERVFEVDLDVAEPIEYFVEVNDCVANLNFFGPVEIGGDAPSDDEPGEDETPDETPDDGGTEDDGTDETGEPNGTNTSQQPAPAPLWGAIAAVAATALAARTRRGS